jgi:hypothetical protein
MGWDGDISAMGRLADRVADLASVPARAARRVSRDLSVFIQDEFDEGQDPYGSAWAPLAPITLEGGRTPPPLTDTTAMRGGIRVAPLRGAGVAITVPHPAAPHQTGWSGPQGSGPARPILPARGALPLSWQDAIEAAVSAEVGRR